MPTFYCGVFLLVRGEKMYDSCEKSYDKISIRTIHQWNPYSYYSGFLMVYFITRSNWGFSINLLISNSDSHFPYFSSSISAKYIDNIMTSLSINTIQYSFI